MKILVFKNILGLSLCLSFVNFAHAEEQSENTRGLIFFTDWDKKSPLIEQEKAQVSGHIFLAWKASENFDIEGEEAWKKSVMKLGSKATEYLISQIGESITMMKMSEELLIGSETRGDRRLHLDDLNKRKGQLEIARKWLSDLDLNDSAMDLLRTAKAEADKKKLHKIEGALQSVIKAQENRRAKPKAAEPEPKKTSWNIPQTNDFGVSSSEPQRDSFVQKGPAACFYEGQGC